MRVDQQFLSSSLSQSPLSLPYTPMSVLDTSIISTTASIQTGGGGSVYESNYGVPVLPASNRVKVAIRLRPPFPEEGLESCVYIPPAPPGPPSSPPPRPHNLQLELSPGKALEFGFDAVFGPSTTNSELYDEVAGPIVDGVLKGVNGTVLAYGQTGSGKTYSLGILTRVTGESGIVPRSLSHIFGAIGGGGGSGSGSGTTYSITMSFLQVYLDSVLDLLAPGSASSPPPPGVSPPTKGGDTTLNSSFLTTGGRGGVNTSTMLNTTNTSSMGGGGGGGASTLGPSLPVREDPMRGFYVEGLTEYTVPSFTEAVALLNWGLENRVLGATRMNATSSRSHTMLIVRVEARTPVSLPPGNGTGSSGSGTPTHPPPHSSSSSSYPGAGAGAGTASAGAGTAGYRTRRSQLMLCDLAGSERVRRTSSRGARLDEARAINASLHTLGQVISALAAVAAASTAGGGGGGGGGRAHHPLPHVPWRDNKLTRLLYGNVGGGANTYLLATLGPAPINASESASTLAFASRCMRVSAHPVASPTSATQGDYVEMVAVLQGKLAGLEAAHASHVGAIVQRYESALGSLAVEVSAARRGAMAAAAASRGGGGGSPSSPLPSPTSGGGSGGGGGGGAGDVSMISTVSSILAGAVGGAGVVASAGTGGGTLPSLKGGSKGVTFFSPSASSTISSSPTTPPLHRPSLQELLALHKPTYTHLVALYEASARALLENTARGERYAVAWLKAIEAAQGDSRGSGGGGVGVPVGGVASILKKPTGGGGSSGGATAASSGRNAAAAMHAVHSLHASNSIPLLSRQQQQASSPKSSSSSSRKGGGSGGISVDGDDDDEDEDEQGEQEETVLVMAGGLNCSPSSPGKKSPSSSASSSSSSSSSSPTNSTKAAAASAAALLGPPALPSTARPGERYPYNHPPLSSFPTLEALLGQCTALSTAAATNTARLERLLEVKDGQFDEVKKQLAAAETAVRMRDEDVQSQRYVLRYLVDSTASLREELRRLKGRSGISAIGAAAYAAAHSAAGGVGGWEDEGGGGGGGGGGGSSRNGGGGGVGGFDTADISISPPLSSSPSPTHSTSLSPPSPLSSSTTAATTKLSVHFAPTPSAPPIPTITASSPLIPSPSTVPTVLGGSIIPSPVAPNAGEAAKEAGSAAAAAVDSSTTPLEEVEYIVDRRVVEGGKVLLKVHWRGSGVEEDEWFSREDLLLDFPLAVKQFEERGGKK